MIQLSREDVHYSDNAKTLDYHFNVKCLLGAMQHHNINFKREIVPFVDFHPLILSKKLPLNLFLIM